MIQTTDAIHNVAHLSKSEFKKLGTFIHSRFGIKMPDSKKGMIESRLRKRLNTLGLNSYSGYCDYLFSPEGMENELTQFINVITTNKTDFFRESRHFTYLVENAVPALLTYNGPGVGKKLMVWCCASSRGHEPYTLAMVLKDFSRTCSGFDFSVLATDISSRVLEIAIKGVYDAGEIDPVPMELRKKYLLKNKDKTKRLVRIVPELRKKVRFQHLNLMDDDYRIRQKMDIIFCRNVIIYFDKQTTEKLLVKLCDQLIPGGFIFMGHSELIDCSMLPLISLAPAVYQKVNR
jgi:chemotaxis protein methyltransferase CheR